MSGAAAAVAEPAPTLRDRWLARRDNWLASPAFQQWAARFPLTRWIAQRRAREVFDLVAGFVYSQVLFACVKLELLELLATGPLTLDAIARRVGLDGEAADRLLRAAVALQLVEPRSGGRFGLGPLGAPIAGSPGIRAMVAHHEMLYGDLADPIALLRRERSQPSRLAGYWPYAGAANPLSVASAAVSDYSTLMSASQPLVAGEILAAHPIARYRCLLDVGGGDGTFLVGAARVAPSLRLMLFDLPAVAERAKARFATEGLADRATAVGGSFLADELPPGADLATLIRVLHDHDDARVATLLRAVHRALEPGGTLLVAEPMAETPGCERMGDAYFGFYLLAMGRGRPRTSERLAILLTEAGFEGVRTLPTHMPLQTRLLVATKPPEKTLSAKP